MNIGDTYMVKLSSDAVQAKIVRELGDEDRDAEVGRMFEVVVQVFEDELHDLVTGGGA
jgi:hypothetical protein